jgi:hypothetical protein
MEYCVYITLYKGTIMPSKYIGSSSIKRIKKGYRGSVCSAKWKLCWNDELKNNPDLFETKIVSEHQTRKEAIDEELRLQKLYGVVRSPFWINEAYAQVHGYAGRDVSGVNNPMYGKGAVMIQWCKDNPEKVSERNRKAAITQWGNEVTRKNKIAAMKGAPREYKDREAFIKEQQRKSLISKEKNAIRLEYKNKVYVGWRELFEATGVSKHLYKKYYTIGIDPTSRIGTNGPVPGLIIPSHI